MWKTGLSPYKSRAASPQRDVEKNLVVHRRLQGKIGEKLSTGKFSFFQRSLWKKFGQKIYAPYHHPTLQG